MRLPDWENRLSAFLAEREGLLFTWGATDCALFSADAVEAMTGEDPAAEFRGRYTTAAGSVRALKRYGAGTLEGTIDGKFEAKPVPFARRGDLVMHGGCVGICLGAQGVFVGEHDGVPGLVQFPRAEWSKAWGV